MKPFDHFMADMTISEPWIYLKISERDINLLFYLNAGVHFSECVAFLCLSSHKMVMLFLFSKVRF